MIDEVVMVLENLNMVTAFNQFKDLKWDDIVLPDPWMGIDLHMCARFLYSSCSGMCSCV